MFEKLGLFSIVLLLYIFCLLFASGTYILLTLRSTRTRHHAAGKVAVTAGQVAIDAACAVFLDSSSSTRSCAYEPVRLACVAYRIIARKPFYDPRCCGQESVARRHIRYTWHIQWRTVRTHCPHASHRKPGLGFKTQVHATLRQYLQHRYIRSERRFRERYCQPSQSARRTFWQQYEHNSMAGQTTWCQE